jgi:hypothetical protein
MRFHLFFFLIAHSILHSGCQSIEVQSDSIGKESELLIVCKDTLYGTAAVKAVLAELTKDYPALPQQESLFDITRINESGFSELFKRHKAIIQIETTSDESRLLVKRNEFARQQAVLQMKIKEQQLNDSLTGYQLGKTAADFFTREERNIRIAKLSKAYNKKVSESVNRKFGFAISVPDDFFIAKDEKNLIWLRRETANTSSALLIYSVPATSSMQPVALRDSITKIHIPGPSVGSYMVVNKEIDPVVQCDSLLSHAAIVTRGIWKVENDFMGGPFVNFYIPDSSNNRILCMDAFVYAPKFDKREYINRLMAIVYSAKAGN